MKKNELINIAINLVVIIALLSIRILTSISGALETVIEYGTYIAMIIMYLQIAKSIYFRIKDDNNSNKILKNITYIYIVSALVYVILNQFVDNIMVVFVFLCMCIAILFAYAALFAAEMYKRIDNKDILGLIKVTIILLTLIILCLLTSLIGKTHDINTMFTLSAYLTLITSTLLLTILILIYVFKKLVFIK